MRNCYTLALLNEATLRNAMAATSVGTPPADDRKLLAPLWHTALLVLFVVSYSLLQVHFSARTETLQLKSRVPLYLFAIFFELILLAYVWFLGVRRSGLRFAAVIGGRWARDRKSTRLNS